MSWEATAWALKQTTGSPSGKAVLLCLANYADASGYCWPKQETIADQTEQSVDSVQRRLNEIERRGLIARERRIKTSGGWSSDGYVLLMPGVKYEPDKRRSKKRRSPLPQSAVPQEQRRATADMRSVATAPVRPESSVESKIESSPPQHPRAEKGHEKGTSDIEGPRSSSAAPAFSPQPPPWRDRGLFEAQVAERIGTNGLEILGSLPDSEVTAICERQRAGTLDAATLEELKINYEKTRDK